MLDATYSSARIQRTRGRARVMLGAAPGGACLQRLHQSGSARVLLPRTHTPRPEVVFLNTAGGLTGGDRLQYALCLAPGAMATATTQTAERAYASAGGVADLRVTLDVGAGGALDWLPQETILYDRSALARRTEITLAGDARLLMAEMVVLGRAAMGESLTSVLLRDHRRISRDGVPVLVEPLCLTDASLARRDTVAGLRGARAFATLVLIAPGAEDALAGLRAALPRARAGTGGEAGGEAGVEAAASGWDGKCVARFIGSDAAALRRALAHAIRTLRGGPLPRVWPN